MAPTRATRQTTASSTLGILKTGINTRSSNVLTESNVNGAMNTRGKRKAEMSPKNERIKRSALGNLTNAVFKGTQNENPTKKQNGLDAPAKKDDGIKGGILKYILGNENAQSKMTRNRTKNHVEIVNANQAKPSTRGNAKLLPPPVPTQQTKVTKKTTTATAIATTAKSKDDVVPAKNSKVTRRISNEFERTEDSLYMSALEDVSTEGSRLSNYFDSQKALADKTTIPEVTGTASDLTVATLSSQASTESANSFFTSSELADEDVSKDTQSQKQLPDGVTDFDKENWDDPFQVSHYAMDIFTYLKQNEHRYKIVDYIEKQPELSKWMRSLLVDWMVEVQESFELNHETLYLAVKIVDCYLGKVRVSKDTLQLLGAAALLIACKFDERTPPLIDDFLYICDGAYQQQQLLKMEMNVFRTINYDLGFPLSYRFLRRYARCGKVSMMTLTLARYILEYSLMDYSTIELSDSKMACAALFIALRMNNMAGWNPTFEYYSGYKLEEFAPIVILLNSVLHRKPKETLSTVRNKYSHKIFHQVTSIPLLDVQKLLENDQEVLKKLSDKQLTPAAIVDSCSAKAPNKDKN